MKFIFSIGDVVHRENRQVGRTRRCISRFRRRLYRANGKCALACIHNAHARSARIPVAGKYTAIGRAERVRKARKRRMQRGRENCRCGTTLPRQIIASRSLSTARSCAKDLSRWICNGISNYMLQTMSNGTNNFVKHKLGIKFTCVSSKIY